MSFEIIELLVTFSSNLLLRDRTHVGRFSVGDLTVERLARTTNIGLHGVRITRSVHVGLAAEANSCFAFTDTVV